MGTSITDLNWDDLSQNGFATIPGVLSVEEAGTLTRTLWRAAEKSRERGDPTYVSVLDPNDKNVRVFDLIALDPAFGDLIQHPVATTFAARLLGDDFIVSNFTANIARPGSGSMLLHSDQGIVVPEPWRTPWSLNIIWCLSDMYAENGATRYVPGSHTYECAADLPEDIEERLVSFEAKAGSVIVMDGRVWHTSGANVTKDQDRPLLFGYYCKPFVRPQWNFSEALSEDQKARFSPEMRRRLGLERGANLGTL